MMNDKIKDNAFVIMMFVEKAIFDPNYDAGHKAGANILKNWMGGDCSLVDSIVNADFTGKALDETVYLPEARADLIAWLQEEQQ